MSFATVEEVRAGLDAYNAFLAETWTFKQGELEARAKQAGCQLAETHRRVKAIESITLDLATPPRLALEPAGGGAGRLKVALTLPGEGSWNIFVRARILLRPSSGGRGHVLKVKVKRLRVRAEIEIDRHSPTSARLVETKVNVELGKVSLRSPSLLLKLFSRLATFFLEILENVIENLARDALAEALPDAAGVAAVEALGLASEAPDLAGEVPPLAQLDDAARAVAARIRRHHMPWGTVLNTLVPKEDPDAAPTGYRHIEDSAIWTGHFLAGEAYRYAVTGEPQAVDNARAALAGLEALVHLAGEPGLLSRVLIPTDSPHAEALRRESAGKGHTGRLFTGVWQGVEYLSLGHITRDQYAGAFLGTGLAATLMADVPEVHTKARELALLMADYLLEQHFCPTEAVTDPDTGTKHTSVTYLIQPTQVLAILQVARTLDPEKYGERFEALAPMGSILWFFRWLTDLDPHTSYYKFNLEHAAALLLLTLEPDAERRRLLSRGTRTMRRDLRHHGNAYFDLVELAALGEDPNSLTRPREEIERQASHLLAEAFGRPALIEDVDLSTDPALELVDFAGLSSEPEKSKPETLARQAVPVGKRPGADFLWQRSPFSLKVVWRLDDEDGLRSPGIDQTLPCWMARHLGL